MKNVMPIVVLAFLATFAVVSIAPDASAATKTGAAYAAKKAECTRKADEMSFGIHRIKRNNWIKDCIAKG